MKNRCFTSALVLTLLLCAVCFAKTKQVGDFSLIDQQGTFHQLSRYADQKAVVIYVQGNGCPIVRLAMPTLKKLRDQFAEQGVVFLLLNANVQDDLPSIRKEVEEFAIDLPILKDDTQLVAEALGVARTGEALVIIPSTKTVVFHGPPDDRFGYETQKQTAEKNYLEDAIKAVLAGKTDLPDAPAAKGCLVAYPARTEDSKRPVSYHKDIVPILKSRCIDCHQTGGIGPFAMGSHTAVQGWSEMMLETVLTKRMPPGQIDNQVGDWLDVHHLTPKEQTTLVHWINAGAPKDGDTDPLTQIVGTDEHAWKFGEPDYIIEIPPQDVPATGIIENKLVTIPLNLTEEKWVRAYQFNIGVREVTHHITTSMVMLGKKPATGAKEAGDDGQPVDADSVEAAAAPKDAKAKGEGEPADADEAPAPRRRRARADGQPVDADSPEGVDPNNGFRGAGFAGYAPGKPIAVYPDDVGYKVGPGMALRASLHYTTNGKPTVDHSRIGLYFHKNTPKYEIKRWSAGTTKLLIPPHAHDYAVSGENSVKVDSYLYNMQPHMHYRGKRIAYTAYYPDGRVEKLLNVPNYSYLWQMIYTPKKPIFLPAGTKIVVSGAFDNSAMNPNNPDPTQEIKHGAQTWQEMFIGHMQVGPAQ